MLKIKISSAGCPSTSIKDQNGFTSISKFLPNSSDIWQDCQFFINEEVKNPDYWVIIDNIDFNQESALINPERIFFLTAEVPFVTSYFNDDQFLDQFHKIFSQHAIFRQNSLPALPFLPFMINAQHGKSVMNYDSEFNYDQMLQNNRIQKTKTISIIASNKGSQAHKLTDFHQIRYLFAHKLKEHFKDKVDLFGYGYNEIKTKAEAIIPYKYHICLENQSTPNVITEKLYDSFLGLSYPIYWGASNVNDYFHENSLTQINIFDFKGSVEIIEHTIEENLFEKNLEFLVQAKNDVLNKYGVFQRIAAICQDDYSKNDTLKMKAPEQEIIITNRDIFKQKKKRWKISRIKRKVINAIKFCGV